MLGSSCRVVGTSNSCSNKVVQSCTTPPIYSNPIAIALEHFSRTSKGVEGYAFSYSLVISRFSCSWTLVIYSLALRTPIYNLWIHTYIGKSAGMASFETCQQPSSTTCANCWFCDTNSSCYSLSCSMLIFCSLRTWIVQLSLVHSSIVISSCSWYSVSHGGAAKLRPRPLIVLTTNLSVSFGAISAPSSNTMAFSICVHNICSTAEDPIARWVERVPTWGGCTYNSCSYTMRAPNTIWCSYINCWRASSVTSRTVSPMSWRSPSIKVMGALMV